MYFDKELHRGYNVYIDAAADDLGTQMDVGVLVMEPGDTYAICDGEKETAVLLFEGAAELTYGEKTVLIERPDCFRHEAYCLLAPRRTKISLIAKSHAELFIQQTPNDRDYEPVLYTPETVQVQHAGANGELMGAMRREIKTFFDYEDVEGTVVALYCPDYMKELNNAGWHLHFVSKDGTMGGHVLDLVVDRADVAWDRTDRFDMLLPDEDFFSGIDFSKDRSEEVRKAETNE